MSLSETSYEILSDLLLLRLESFLVTSNEEAKELRMLKHAQRELENLQKIGESMALAAPAAAASAAGQPFAAGKLPRRLQRLIQTEAQRAG
jgi:hypothetical protein